jgi:hypothetical protein
MLLGTIVAVWAAGIPVMLFAQGWFAWADDVSVQNKFAWWVLAWPPVVAAGAAYIFVGVLSESIGWIGQRVSHVALAPQRAGRALQNSLQRRALLESGAPKPELAQAYRESDKCSECGR